MFPSFLDRARTRFSGRLRSQRLFGKRRWADSFRWLVLPAFVSILTGCGGGEDVIDPLPTALTATQAAQMLTTSPKSYPAAMAVRVTASGAEIQVAGVQAVGRAPLRGSEAFPVGSLTKSMTAVLAGVLVQDGRLTWNTRLVDVFPEFASAARTDYAGVTLADLLAHRGGLFPATTAEQLARLPALSGTAVEQRAQLVGWMLKQPPSSTPQMQSQYSNGGYVAAAAMMERVTGQAYEALLSARVFQPMGVEVSFGTPGAVAGEPWGHAWVGGKWVAVSPLDPDAQFPHFANPAGGAKLNATALARYLRMHLRAYRGLGGEVLSPATAKVIHTMVQAGFSLGWQDGKDLLGRPVHWHNGSDDTSYYALMTLSLSDDRAAAVVVTGLGGRTEADLSEAAVRMLR